MNNLPVFRGNTPKKAMIGPCDSYGNLEKPHEKAFSIKIQDGFPSFLEHSIHSDIKAYNTNKRMLLPNEYISLRGHWYSGKDKSAIDQKRKEYKQANADGVLFGGSLFPDSGLLEIDGKMSYKLPTFDATQVDLSSFKARLVRNDQPFRIVTTPIMAPLNTICAYTFLLFKSSGISDLSLSCRQKFLLKGCQIKSNLFLETVSFLKSISDCFMASGNPFL